MYRFQHPEYLYALLAVPLLVLLYVFFLFWKKSTIKKMGDEHLVKKQMLGFIPGRITLKFVLLSLGLSFLIIGWANLQKGGKAEKVDRKGVDVMFCLDLSKSMLAKDVSPDRLTRAKQFILRSLDKMKNDRVGLVIFAGRAYLQVPITVDYSSLKMILQTIDPSVIPTQGTVIGDAIDLAASSFSNTEKKYKSIVVISDGEDHDATALAMVEKAGKDVINVHTVGVGSEQGSAILDPDTRTQKLDDKGNPVISKLNEEELKGIASKGNGRYIHLNNPDAAASALVEEISNMEQRNLGTVVYKDYTNYFQYFLAAGMLLLILEIMIPGASAKQKGVIV